MTATHAIEMAGDRSGEIRHEHELLCVLVEEERGHDPGRPDGQQQADRAAGHRYHHRVGEQLPDELRPARAKRHAHRRLPRARGRA
jgi:hypothetical protein